MGHHQALLQSSTSLSFNFIFIQPFPVQCVLILQEARSSAFCLLSIKIALLTSNNRPILSLQFLCEMSLKQIQRIFTSLTWSMPPIVGGFVLPTPFWGVPHLMVACDGREALELSFACGLSLVSQALASDLYFSTSRLSIYFPCHLGLLQFSCVGLNSYFLPDTSKTHTQTHREIHTDTHKHIDTHRDTQIYTHDT